MTRRLLLQDIAVIALIVAAVALGGLVNELVQALALAICFYFLGRRHGRRDGACVDRARLAIVIGPITQQTEHR